MFHVRLALIASILVTSISMSLAAGKEITQFRGPNRDGIFNETGLLQTWPEGGPKLEWKITGLGKGYSSISIAGGKIFTMGDRGKDQFVIAFDLDSHKELWATKVGAGHNDGPRCTPTLDGDLLYALGAHGDLVCLKTADGGEVWRKNFKNDFDGFMMSMWMFSESPLVDGDKLVCTPGGKDTTIVALNKKTGETIWKCAVPSLGPAGKDGAGYSSIVISNACGVKQYVQLLGRGVVGVRAEDGKFLWGYNKVANGTANITNPIVSGDYVFATSSYRTGSVLLKLSPDGDGVKAQEVYWLPFTQFNNHHGGVVLVDGYLYGGDGQNNGTPTCIEMKTGKIVWKQQDHPGKRSAAVIFADKRLYVRFEDGVMALLEANPAEFKLCGTFKLPVVTGPSWPHPILLDGKLYVRDNDTLMCYDVKAKSE